MDTLLERRRAASHLNLALDQSEDRFVKALEEVVKAWGRAEVERSAGLKHTVIYEVFKGRPRFDTVSRIVKALGLKIIIAPRGQRPYQ
jgi:probable addiction module antidote protein